MKVIIPGPDGGVTASEWITTLDAGTSQVNIQTQAGGSPVPHFIGSSNLAGAQKVTTPAGSTPSVAWSPGYDLLQVTADHNITSLTVTGLNDVQDVCYDIGGHVVNGGAQVSLKPNGAASVGAVGFFETNSTLALTGTAASGLMWMDSDTAGVKGAAFARVCGTSVGRSFYSTMITRNGGGGFTEWYWAFDANSSGTTPMTTATLNGAVNSGTVFLWKRERPSSN